MENFIFCAGFGAKIKTSSESLENVYTSQFEGAQYKSY